jgi:hypothetical protein
MTTESRTNESKAKQDEGFFSGLSSFSPLKSPFPVLKRSTMPKMLHLERYGVQRLKDCLPPLPDGHIIRRALHLDEPQTQENDVLHGPQPELSTKQAPVTGDQEEKETQEEAHVPRLGRIAKSDNEAKMHRSNNVLRDGSSDFISTIRQIHPGFCVLIMLLVPVALTAAVLIGLWLSQVMIVLRERMRPHSEEVVLPKGLSYLGYVYLLMIGRGRDPWHAHRDRPPEHE